MRFFKRTDRNGYEDWRVGRIILFIFLLLGLILTFSQSWSIIPTGYTGVRVTFGQIDSRPVPNGFNWKIPYIQSIKKVNNKQQDITFNSQVWSETAQRTALYFERVTVTYQVNSEKSAWIYANVSDYTKNLVSEGLLASSLKAASKTLTDTDATNRAIIEPLAMIMLQSALDGKYGADVVIINKVVISNVDFEEAYSQAIAKKQNEQLEYERKQIENRTRIEAAEADAETERQRAQGEADAKRIAAEAEAEANRMIAESLTEAILQFYFYEKWDGALPKVVGADGTILDIGALIGQLQTGSSETP